MIQRPWSFLVVVICLAGATPAFTATVDQKEVTAIIALPDNNTLVYASLDGSLHFWNLAQGKEDLQIQAHKYGVYGLALSSDGKWFASAGADRLVRLWDMAKLKEVHTLEGHSKEVVGIVFSPDNRTIASCGYDGTIRLWDVASGKLRRVLRGHGHKVTSVAFSPDGQLLASGGIVPFETEFFKGSTEGDEVRLWDPQSGKEIRRLSVKGQRVAFTPDGKNLVASAMYIDPTPAGGLVVGNQAFDAGSRITVWDLKNHRERVRLNEYSTAIALSADGKYLASSWGTRLHGGGTILTRESKNKGIHLWDLITGNEVLALPSPEDTGTVLAFTPDSKRLVAGRRDGALRFWNVADRAKKSR